MKKIMTIVICLVLALSMVGCTKTELKIGKESSVIEGTDFDVTMEVVEGTATPLTATVLITNNTDIEMESGNAYDFSIEVLKDGKWKTIDIGERINTTEAIGFAGESELVLEWSDLYGELPGGNYRIVKSFFPWVEDGTYGIHDMFWLTAEFVIE